MERELQRSNRGGSTYCQQTLKLKATLAVTHTDGCRDRVRALIERSLEGKARMNAYKERLAETVGGLRSEDEVEKDKMVLMFARRRQWIKTPRKKRNLGREERREAQDDAITRSILEGTRAASEIGDCAKVRPH